jgi:hypothetical protein
MADPVEKNRHTKKDETESQGDLLVSDTHSQGVQKVLDFTVRHISKSVLKSVGVQFRFFSKKHPEFFQTPLACALWPGYKGAAANFGEAEKMEHYMSRYHIRAEDVIPIALDSYGFMGQKAHRFFVQRFKKDSKERNDLYRSIAVTLQQWNLKLFEKTRFKTVSGGRRG